VALGVWIGVGSRFEAPEVAGISHFIEHLLFKGTPRHSAEQIAQLFDGLGGEVNAATGRDYTVLYSRVLDEHVERAFGVLADMIQRPGFFDLDQEREVVLEEIAMYEDDPQDTVHDLISSAVFPGQALGRPVIGTRGAIAGVPESGIRDYHHAHYTAQNMVVAASGAVEHERLVELSASLLGDLPADAEPRTFEAASAGAPALVVREKTTEQYHLCFGGPGLTRNDPRRHAMSVLDTVLGGSMSSRLFQEIRERRGLAYSVGTWVVGYADTGQVGGYLGTREDNLATSCEILAAELRRMAEQPVPAEELRRAKDHLKGRLVLGLESPATRMNRIGRSVLTDTELLSVDEIIERIEAVGTDDVLELAAAHWAPGDLSVAAIGPKSDVVREAVERLSPGLVSVAAP
jgi:predicted Zn-dependent peptidase